MITHSLAGLVTVTREPRGGMERGTKIAHHTRNRFNPIRFKIHPSCRKMFVDHKRVGIFYFARVSFAGGCVDAIPPHHATPRHATSVEHGSSMSTAVQAQTRTNAQHRAQYHAQQQEILLHKRLSASRPIFRPPIGHTLEGSTILFHILDLLQVGPVCRE
jgi:hypothetical protein